MANQTIKIEGLRGLEMALSELQNEYGGRAAAQALRPAVKAALAPVEDAVRQDTPVDTGTLRASIKTVIGKPTKRMVTQSQHYNMTTILAGRTGWFWSRPSLWNQALAVEFGTSEVPAQHVLERVFDRHADAMLMTFKNTLGPAIEKKATQLARKAARMS